MSHGKNLGHNLIKAVSEQSYDEIVDLWAFYEQSTHTLNSAASVDDESITVTDATGITTNEVICLKENARYYQGIVTGVVGNVVSLDTPLDADYSTSAIVKNGIVNMNVNGSSTIQKFKVGPPTNTIWHIYRCIFTITDGTAMDDSTFGGISALTNGVLIRCSNGIHKNIFNVKSNGDFISIAYDARYSSKAPAGEFGFSCRRTFNGDDKNGSVIRLNGSDSDTFEFWVRDDLTDLLTFKVRVQGHRLSR